MININKVKNEFEVTRAYARVYVQGNLDQLRSQYGEKYLAIVKDAGVIDSDKSKTSLIKRLQESNNQRGIVIDTIVNFTKPKLSNN